jgi:hypothetical protein
LDNGHPVGPTPYASDSSPLLFVSIYASKFDLE